MKTLIDEITSKTKEMEILKKDIEKINSKLQEKAIKILEDRNVKTTESYGSNNNSVIITFAQKAEILNYQELEKYLDNELLSEKVKKEVELRYKINDKFKKALIILYTNDYIKDFSLEDFVKQEFKELESSQISLICKKLKGDYKKDKELLFKYIVRQDLDEELYFINKIKNYELVKAFFDVDNEEVKKAITNYVSLDESVKVTLKYE